MYEVVDKAYSWLATYRTLKSGEVVPNRGARSTLVTQGVFIIDHLSTGKFIIGTSRTVSADIDKQMALLRAGKHPNVKLQRQYTHDQDLRLIEVPAADAKNAKQIEARIRSSNTTDYCLLN